MDLQSGNTKFGSKLAIFVSCDLDIWRMTLKNNRAPLLCYFKLCASFHSHPWIQTRVTVQKWLSWVLTSVTLTFDPWPWPFAWISRLSLVITPENFMMIRWWEHSEKGVTDGRMDRRTERSVLRAAWSQVKNRCRWISGNFDWQGEIRENENGNQVGTLYAICEIIGTIRLRSVYTISMFSLLQVQCAGQSWPARIPLVQPGLIRPWHLETEMPYHPGKTLIDLVVLAAESHLGATLILVSMFLLDPILRGRHQPKPAMEHQRDILILHPPCPLRP